MSQQLLYKVMVDDNFHFMDGSERYELGEYNTLKEATAECRNIVDCYLTTALNPNMTATELYESYTMFGEDPYIISNEVVKFSAWKYAKSRCQLLASAVNIKTF